MAKTFGRLMGMAVAAAALGAAVPASAQMIAAANPESVAKVLRDRGYRAELTKDNQGDPLIRSGAEGANFLILFFNCTPQRGCATVQFYAGFDRDGQFSLERLNEWNKSKRFGRAYRDSEGDPVVEMDLDLDDGGMSQALFEDNLEFWTTILGQFRRFLDEKPGE